MELDNELFSRAVEAVERLATASEELNALAKNERDLGEQIVNQFGPAFCPHCQKLDPQVVTEGSGQGLMSEFVLVLQCVLCMKQFFGIPEGWIIAPDIDTAKQLREARRAENDDNGS